MMSQKNAPVIFSSQSNPYLRLEESKPFTIFGKEVDKKKAMEALMSLGGMGEEEDPNDLSSYRMSFPKLGKPSGLQYSPRQMYGGMLGSYGAGRVRGGLLGE
jgi:hypothetical protein